MLASIRKPEEGVRDHQAGSSPRHLLPVFPSFGVGGCELRMATMANAFGPKYRHTIIALDGNFACESRLTPDAPYVLLRMEINKRNTFANLLRFRSKIAALQPDLLLTYNFGAIEWALANRFRPVLSHIHFEVGFGAEEAVTQFKRRIFLRWLALSGKSRVVVPSRTLHGIARRT